MILDFNAKEKSSNYDLFFNQYLHESEQRFFWIRKWKKILNFDVE